MPELIVVHDKEETEAIKVSSPNPSDHGFVNYGRCPICGEEHILSDDGSQCGKG